MTLRRALPAVSLVLFSVAALAPTVHAQAPLCDAITKNGRWEAIRIPEFEVGPAELLNYEVDPSDPQRLYLANAQSVMVSTDGGCSWRTTFRLDQPLEGADYSDSDSAITHLTVAAGHALVTISQADGVRPHVAISNYGGESWRRGDEGLRTITGSVFHAGFTSANPQYAYLLLNEQIGSDDAGLRVRDTILESTSSGGSWTSRDEPSPFPEVSVNTPVGPLGFSRMLEGLVPDPIEAGKIFLYGRDGLFSYQAGTDTELLEGEITALGVLPGPTSARTTLLTAIRGQSRLQISRDAGASFTEVDVPGDAQSFARALDPRGFYASIGGRVMLRSNNRFTDISPSAPVEDLRSAYTSTATSPLRTVDEITLYGRSEGTLVRTTERNVTTSPIPVPPPETVKVGKLPPFGAIDPNGSDPGLILPANTQVELTEGENAAVAYELFLPPTPTPLDVMFDMDTSNSMAPAIDGLRAAISDIVEELSALGIDAWFGAAHYRSYSTPPAFERLQDIAPPDEGLAAALNKMVAEGGGDETQLESLRQIVTGAGTDGAVMGEIAPGQQANWREGSLRIIVHMTDEPISEGGPHPAYEDVARDLKEDEAIHFGIALQNEATAEALGPPLPGLIKISRLSDSLAPPQGVDCDGDLDSDLYDGEPLVCVIDHVSSRDAAVMGGAILSVLESVVDVGEVSLSARVAGEGAERDPEIPIAQTSFPAIDGIDFKQHNAISFGVTFTCPAVDAVETFPVDIQAARVSGILGGATATLTCNPIPDAPAEVDDPKPPPVVTPAAIPPVAIPLIAPAPPPPAPVHQPQPGPNPNPNPQPQPNPQAQAQPQIGMASQRQEQLQLAFAHSAGKAPQVQAARADQIPREERYAMSRYRERQTTEAPIRLYLSAAAMSLAFVATQKRRQMRRAYAERRSRF